MTRLKMIPSPRGTSGTAECLACGTRTIKPGRRYCSKECRQQMVWVLSLSKGLLKVFNARYAAFTFNRSFVVLDVLPVWSSEISRFIGRRAGKKPADDLKGLILRSGEEWYHLVNNRTSRSYASLSILKKNHAKSVPAESIRPNRKIQPRFSRHERESLRLLKLKMEELLSDGKVARIKSAYKRLAKIYHPDVGGDTEKFKRLNEAHQQMLAWAQDPQFTTRKALVDCWSYDGATARWSPPL